MTNQNLPESPVSATVKLHGVGGADVLLTIRDGATVESAQTLIDTLAGAMKYAKDKYGLTPQANGNGHATNGATNGNGAGPVCPEGHGPMKASTKKAGSFYCPAVITESAGKKVYCQQKA